MNIDEILAPPQITAHLPGIGGRIKVMPEDFVVEEIPAYEPSGAGEHLFLWLEKRDMGAEYFIRQVARRLEIPSSSIGVAGLKDRRAVTRQYVSVPAAAESKLALLDGNGIRLLRSARHGNKLRTGHLHGNRFQIVVREVDADAIARASVIRDHLLSEGVPNYYGAQRFGSDLATLQLGMDMIAGRSRGPRNPFVRKLALSSVQSALFNLYLAQRITDGIFRKVILGDVMARYPAGGMFVAENVQVEQVRFDAREIVTAGPIFGTKTFPAKDEAAQREQLVLEANGFTSSSFAGFGKLLPGTRRHNLYYLEGLHIEDLEGGICISFTLPAGAYATIVLSEFMKASLPEEEALTDSDD